MGADCRTTVERMQSEQLIVRKKRNWAFQAEMWVRPHRFENKTQGN
jgi:hypothetical protein